MGFPPIAAYDRVITVFSPDGRIYQIEYAYETVKKGSLTIGIVCKEGGVLAAEERLVSKLQDPRVLSKVFQIDTHIGAAVAGLSADARVLIDRARIYAQGNRLLYDEPIDLEVLAKRTGDFMQLYTQHAGFRPFGVSIFFSGIDKTGPHLFQIDPGGACFGFKASAVGIGSDIAKRILEEDYREDLTLEEAILLAIKCLSEAIEGIDASKIIMAIIPTDTKEFKLLTKEEVEKYLRKYLESKASK